MFYVETQKAILLSSEDSIEACILRMSKCVNEVRSLMETAKRYGSIDDVWTYAICTLQWSPLRTVEWPSAFQHKTYFEAPNFFVVFCIIILR